MTDCAARESPSLVGFRELSAPCIQADAAMAPGAVARGGTTDRLRRRPPDRGLDCNVVARPQPEGARVMSKKLDVGNLALGIGVLTR
jgi:hypothetical protein